MKYVVAGIYISRIELTFYLEFQLPAVRDGDSPSHKNRRHTRSSVYTHRRLGFPRVDSEANGC